MTQVLSAPQPLIMALLTVDGDSDSDVEILEDISPAVIRVEDDLSSWEYLSRLDDVSHVKDSISSYLSGQKFVELHCLRQ